MLVQLTLFILNNYQLFSNCSTYTNSVEVFVTERGNRSTWRKVVMFDRMKPEQSLQNHPKIFN
jgi:hypothetical protein